MPRLLAISGSLRAASSNTAVVEAARALAPPGLEVMVYEGLGEVLAALAKRAAPH